MMNPAIKNSIKIGVSVALGATLSYLQATLAHGIPPQNQWGSIALTGLCTGLVAVFHLYSEHPDVAQARYLSYKRMRTVTPIDADRNDPNV